MSEWQPIETAPKDCTEVLLFVTDLGPRPAYWDDDEWLSPVDGTSTYANDEITHWMPYPEPPK